MISKSLLEVNDKVDASFNSTLTNPASNKFKSSANVSIS